MTPKYEEIKAEEDSVRESIFLLRRTVGSLMWLDVLTDEEFCLIQDEIISVFIEHSKKFRSESCG